MAITINTVPARIDNLAKFNVTTDLVEDATHVNLRVRADIYHEGIIKAIVEKPKGLSNFDFSNILKTLIPGLKAINQRQKDAGGGFYYYETTTPHTGAQMITSWASHSGTWTTLTTSGAQIISAICTDLSYLETNAISMYPGEMYALVSTDFISTGTPPTVKIDYLSGQAAEIVMDNKTVILMPVTSGPIKIILGGTTNEDFEGYFELRRIETDQVTIGRMMAPYYIYFHEVYENVSGVTQVGNNYDTTPVFRFVNAKGDISAFTEYVLHDSTSLFANKTFRNNVTKFFTKVPYEQNIVFYSEYFQFNLFYSKDGQAYDQILVLCWEGWGLIPISIVELMASVASNLRIYMAIQLPGGLGGLIVSEVMTIYVDKTQIDERVILEYDGVTGGKEYLSFEGLKDIGFTTIRNYFTAATKNRKPLSLTGINRQSLETRFKDINNTSYLKSLLTSEVVKRLEASLATPTEVAIVSDSVRIASSEMFTNKIDIEYED